MSCFGGLIEQSGYLVWSEGVCICISKKQWNGKNLGWDCRVFGWEVDIELKDTASVRSVFGPSYHGLQQGGLLIVASEKQS